MGSQFVMNAPSAFLLVPVMVVAFDGAEELLLAVPGVRERLVTVLAETEVCFTLGYHGTNFRQLNAVTPADGRDGVYGQVHRFRNSAVTVALFS